MNSMRTALRRPDVQLMDMAVLENPHPVQRQVERHSLVRANNQNRCSEFLNKIWRELQLCSPPRELCVRPYREPGECPRTIDQLTICVCTAECVVGLFASSLCCCKIFCPCRSAISTV